MDLVDAHVHVWTDDLERYPVAPGVESGDMKPPAFTPDELLSHARACGVDRIVLVQMSYYRADNAYILDVIRDHPGVFAGIAIVDPHSPEPDAAMRRLAGSGVRGFRVSPAGDPLDSWLDGEGYERMFQVAVEDGLAICPLIGTDALPALCRRCARFPQAPVIIDHLCRIGAGAPITDEAMEALCGMARFPRVMVKVSAFYALGSGRTPYDDLAPLIRRVHRAFGSERLMWASDSPFQVQPPHTYAASLELVQRRLDFLSPTDRERILGGTAAGFFFR